MRLAFKCEDCGEIFEDHDIEYHRVNERHYWLDDSPIEQLEFRACPYCHSEDIEEIIVDDEDEDESEE